MFQEEEEGFFPRVDKIVWNLFSEIRKNNRGRLRILYKF